MKGDLKTCHYGAQFVRLRVATAHWHFYVQNEFTITDSRFCLLSILLWLILLREPMILLSAESAGLKEQKAVNR